MAGQSILEAYCSLREQCVVLEILKECGFRFDHHQVDGFATIPLVVLQSRKFQQHHESDTQFPAPGFESCVARELKRPFHAKNEKARRGRISSSFEAGDC
jgi:hypothetical protein